MRRTVLVAAAVGALIVAMAAVAVAQQRADGAAGPGVRGESSWDAMPMQGGESHDDMHGWMHSDDGVFSWDEMPMHGEFSWDEMPMEGWESHDEMHEWMHSHDGEFSWDEMPMHGEDAGSAGPCHGEGWGS